jgi:hypothetical protein
MLSQKRRILVNVTEKKYIRGEGSDKEERVAVDFMVKDGIERFEVSALLLRLGTPCHMTERGFTIELPDDVRLELLRFVQENREMILAAHPVKTRAGWSESGIAVFREYCKPGDTVDDAMVAYFRDSLLPATSHTGFLQAGDPVNSEADWFGQPRATYTTFCKEESSWIYKGSCFLEEDINRETAPRTIETEIKNLEQKYKECKYL